MSAKKLKMNVPDNFYLPFCPSASVKIIMENKNSSWIDFDIETNSSQTLKIKPKKGCVGIGKEVHILISRPKFLPSTFTSEYLILKIKYCTVNKYENAKYSKLHQHSEEQIYIIDIKISNGNICSKQAYCDCKICKGSTTHNNQLYHHLSILSDHTSANSLSTDKTRFSNGTKHQRKRRYPFTIYHPFSNEAITIQNENTRRYSREGFRRVSPLKHTAGDDKNVSAINKYIEVAKIKNTLLKRNNDSKECCVNASDLNHCHLSNEETLQKIENHHQFDEKNPECKFSCLCELPDHHANDICCYHDCSKFSPPLKDCHQDHEDISSNESSDECCFRDANNLSKRKYKNDTSESSDEFSFRDENNLSKKIYKNEDAKEKKREDYASTEDVTNMARRSVIKFVCFSALILIPLGITTFHL